MRLAQQLYEGIDIKGNGTVGIITYLRTDSTRISQEADEAARAYIGEQYGESYVKNSGNAEGISFKRPVPSLSAYMEAFYCKQNGAGAL